MKILFCAPVSGNDGGIKRWAEHIIRQYKSSKSDACDIELKVSDTGRVTFVASPSLPKRIYGAMKDYYQVYREYSKNVASFHPDIVHLTTSASLSLVKDLWFINKAHKCGAKVNVHFHFGRIPHILNTQNWEYKLLIRVLEKADRVVVIDNASKKAMDVAGYGSKTDYIPNPVSPQIADMIKSQGEIERVPNKIAYAGHMLPAKGVFELLDAVAQIPTAKLVMLGRSTIEMLGKMQQRVEELGISDRVDFMGEIPFDQVIAHMCSASVFTLPSYTEGFPNVIIESMACGCPIVATSVGAIPEMLDEGAGMVIEPRTVEPLLYALKYLLGHPEESKKMGEQAKQRVYERYSIDAVWDKLTESWNKM